MAGLMPQTVRGTSIPVQPNGTVDMNVLMAGTVDRITGNYYDTLKLANTVAAFAPQYNLFTAPIGKPDPYPLVAPPPVKTKVETNNVSDCSNGFAPPFDIVVDSIGNYILGNAALADVLSFIEYSYFEMSILQKVQWDGHFETYPPGQGVFGATSQAAESAWQLGIVSPDAKKRFGRFGKYLAPQVMWSYNLFFPAQSGPIVGGVPAAAGLATGGNGLVFRAYLFGLVDRPVT